MYYTECNLNVTGLETGVTDTETVTDTDLTEGAGKSQSLKNDVTRSRCHNNIPSNAGSLSYADSPINEDSHKITNAQIPTGRESVEHPRFAKSI